MLVQINNARFQQWVQPDIELDIFAKVNSHQAKLTRAEAKTEAQGSEVASTEILMTFESKAKLGLPRINPLLENYLEQSSLNKQNNSKVYES